MELEETVDQTLIRRLRSIAGPRPSPGQAEQAAARHDAVDMWTMVDCRRREATMAQQPPEDPYARAGFQKVDGEAVAQGIHSHSLLNAQEFAGAARQAIPNVCEWIGPRPSRRGNNQRPGLVRRPLPPLPYSMRMTIRLLSISFTFRRTDSRPVNPPHRWS